MSTDEIKAELRTGVIPAAGYADKLRRVAIAAFKKYVPLEVILRDVGELNKKLYKIMVEERKYEKRDLIRIVVNAKYDKNENKLVFDEPVIERFLPESKIEQFIQEKVKEIETNLKKKYEDRIKELTLSLEKYKSEIKKLTETVKNYEKRIIDLQNQLNTLSEILKKIKSLTENYIIKS